MNEDKLDTQLYNKLSHLIEQSKAKVVQVVNSSLTLLFWQVGRIIMDDFLANKRATYGAKIVTNLSYQLEINYGRNFNEKNVRRMMQFAEQFPEIEIVVPLARQLSWSHFLIILPLKTNEERLFYCKKSIDEKWSKRELRTQISKKLFERTAIANLQIIQTTDFPLNTFKDPYLLDFLGLKSSYLEKDLEQSILNELESFILELGKGFAFVERQKRIIIDGEDFYLDLLFYHRKLKRLIAIELKIGKFTAKYKGQMELYLKWLNKYERHENENSPLGLILCAEGNREQVELLEMHKDGIIVAEYWTELPEKIEIEKRLHQIISETKDRIGYNNLKNNS